MGDLPDLSRAESEKIKQLFTKYLEEARATEVMKWRTLSKRAAAKGSKAHDKHKTFLEQVARKFMQQKLSANEHRLHLIYQILWAWQWTLAEMTCPEMVLREQKETPATVNTARTVERAPWDIRKLDERLNDIREDLGSLGELLRWNKQRRENELPHKAKRQKLREKYRVKTPAMWEQLANRLTDELATIKAQRHRLSRRPFKRDSAGLAMRLKSDLLRQTTPEVEHMAPEEQKVKVVEASRVIWSQASVESSIVAEKWFKNILRKSDTRWGTPSSP